MKQKIRIIGGIGSVCLFLLGCLEPQIVVDQEAFPQDKVTYREEAEANRETPEMQRETPVDTEQESEFGEPAKIQETPAKEITLAVHVCGAVKQPGVYLLQEPSRVYEGIEMAGGFTEEADQDYLNLAQCLEDGMKVYVPTREEVTQWEEQGENPMASYTLGGKEEASGNNTKVNINTADEALLCTLPGIGESKAKRIIQYRKEHGPFQTIEDIMKVTGIKEGAYEQIKEMITVS